MKLGHWILDEHHRVQPATLYEWATWFENGANRIVAKTRFECGVLVSTIFLGIDHRFGGRGPPLLFETMTFELTMDGDGDQRRYSSWDDAVIGHAATVRKVKAQLEMAGLSIRELENAKER